ncbi:uncharacterized protein LOC114538385, partial [Dendronephthya gigantea]
IVNGESVYGPAGPPSQHIALHLLSKVLDDETIFNLEESNTSSAETFLPLTVDPTRPSESSLSWPSPSPQPSPDYTSKPEHQSSSFPGEHIWQNNADVNHNNSLNTPITSPSPVPPHGWVIQSPSSSPVAYLGRSENGTPFINGYESLPSPQMSSSVESLGNGSFFNPQYCSPTVHDDWTHLSDSENARRGELVDQGGSFDFSRVSPAHPSVGLVCLSGSWPQNGQLGSGYEKGEGETQQLKNGYCTSWKGCEMTDYQGKPIPFQRSISCKSDDDSWIGRGKESLTGSSYPKHNPSNELHIRIDQCYEQLRHLEKERRKAEVDISKFWPTRRVSSGCVNVSTGRLHHSPSRVDKLLIDVQKEHAKVEALVGRIERIRHSPLNINISESVDDMMACIRRLQSSRKDEINVATGRHKSVTGMRSPDGRDIISLISSVRDLSVKTRGCRTAVWCASQLVLNEMMKTTVVTQRSRRSSSTSEGGIESSPSSANGGVS